MEKDISQIQLRRTSVVCSIAFELGFRVFNVGIFFLYYSCIDHWIYGTITALVLLVYGIKYGLIIGCVIKNTKKCKLPLSWFESVILLTTDVICPLYFISTIYRELFYTGIFFHPKDSLRCKISTCAVVFVLLQYIFELIYTIVHFIVPKLWLYELTGEWIPI